MSFDRFLLAFESRDLSQADKRIIRVSSFPSFHLSMITYIYTQKRLFGKIDVLVNFIQNFQALRDYCPISYTVYRTILNPVMWLPLKTLLP